MNITSLTDLRISYLRDSDLPVLTNIVQSHRTLEVLEIREIMDRSDSPDLSTNLLQLIEAAGIGNSQFKKLTF